MADRLLHAACSALFVGLLTVPQSRSLAARQQPSRQVESFVTIRQEQACVFSDALTALAAQGKVAFVVEGRPLKFVLPQDQAPKPLLDITNAPLSTAVK